MTTRTAVAALMVIAECAAGAVACQSRPEGAAPEAARLVAQAPAADRSAPTLQELKSATYRGVGEAEADFTLANGRWEGTPYEPGPATPEVTVTFDHFARPPATHLQRDMKWARLSVAFSPPAGHRLRKEPAERLPFRSKGMPTYGGSAAADGGAANARTPISLRPPNWGIRNDYHRLRMSDATVRTASKPLCVNSKSAPRACPETARASARVSNSSALTRETTPSYEQPVWVWSQG